MLHSEAGMVEVELGGRFRLNSVGMLQRLAVTIWQ
jgi:hypothetical protein